MLGASGVDFSNVFSEIHNFTVLIRQSDPCCQRSNWRVDLIKATVSLKLPSAGKMISLDMQRADLFEDPNVFGEG